MNRPWGQYRVLLLAKAQQTFLEDQEYLVKRLVIRPGQMTSLQSHEFRDEYWVCVGGRGLAWREEGDKIQQLGPKMIKYLLVPGIHLEIPERVKHRIQNTQPLKSLENLVIIETQLGEKVSEDDIIRYDDKYGRV